MFRKISKIICLSLVICLFSVSTIFATEIPQGNVNIKVTDVNNAIQIITNQYLKINPDGTFSISQDASKIIDSTALNTIMAGMSSVNQNIKLGNLISSKINGVITVKSSINYNPQFLMAQSKSGIIQPMAWGLDSYTTLYTWSWWGFSANLNTTGTKVLRNSFIEYAAELTAGGIVSAFLSCGLGLGAALIGGVAIANMIRICSDAIDSNGGVTCTCLGSPSNAELIALN